MVVRWPVGGIRTFLRYVYGKFDTSSWEFVLLAPDLQETRVLLNEDLRSVIAEFIPMQPNPGFVSIARRVLSELSTGQYSLVHSHGFTAGVCTAIPAKLSGVIHLMTSHDVINRNQFLGVIGRAKMTTIGLMLSLLDCIHSVSEDAQANLLEQLPILRKQMMKCIVIEHGIETERFRNVEPINFRESLDLPDSVFLVGFFGRFMSQKGFRYLVEAIGQLVREKSLVRNPVVLCFGEDGFVREEKSAVREKGLIDHFLFLPFTPNISGAIAGVDAVVMPSLWEACGLLAMETLVVGTPLIATDCIGLREVVKDTPTHKVPTRDSNAIANVIITLMHSQDRSTCKGFAEIAAERFDVGKQRRRLEEVYWRVLNQKEER